MEKENQKKTASKSKKTPAVSPTKKSNAKTKPSAKKTSTARKAPRRAPLQKTTHLTTAQAAAQQQWIHIDAKDQILGRLAAKVATILRGKHKPEYSPHVDVGDAVIITNAQHIKLTGAKWKNKMIYRHTGHVGGLVSKTAQDFHERHPDKLIRKAITNMLPKTTLGRHMLKKLKIFPGAEHKQQAQKPTSLSL